MKCWLHAKSLLPMDWAFGRDDFFGQAIPELRSRIKVNLRTQDIDVFEYGPGSDYQSLMYLKSGFMAADQEG